MQIFVTPRAEATFHSIIENIELNWGKNAVNGFIKQVDDIFELLQKHPFLGQGETDDIRGLQLSQQTRILYRIRGDKIIILTFFDVRQSPEKKIP